MVDMCGMRCPVADGWDVPRDLWWQNVSDANPSRPAVEYLNPLSCSQQSQEGCVFEDDRFAQYAEHVIRGHPLDGTPLFLFWSTHGMHGPRQVPDATLARFSGIDNGHRRLYAALASHVDGLVSGVVNLLKERGMWKDTLFLVSSDNGGDPNDYGGNNYPLRGSKFSNWEGGIRVPAFVSGGFVPERMRGTKLAGLGAVWDFYATMCGVAGVDIEDHVAAEAGLPAVDGVNQWPYWSGETNVPPRNELAIGGVYGDPRGGDPRGVTTVEGLISGKYKLLVGQINEAIWTGPKFPNGTILDEEWGTTVDCSVGCLYDLESDEGEHNDLAAANPELVSRMLSRMQEINATCFTPWRGPRSPLGCKRALEDYNGVWGPFLDVEQTTIV